MARSPPSLPSPSRRAFLRGRVRAERALRPPWALPEEAFTATCTACRACVDACPETVLVRGSGGYPVFNPALGECTFCGRCETACTPRALDRARAQAPWTLVARVAQGCLPLQGVVCRSCRDACGEDAITFPPGARTAPRSDSARCTGCGACVGTCPVSAITLQHEAVEHAALEHAT
ncbi:MAG: ferredoxin-type protein NapF [Gammaproteobacteria bacterium]|nr:ferredoxin-type protein NapF [Gammaproteobacteria bacterium]